MRWLVLGGTKFLGRAFVEEALVAGHDVTLFNRGKTGPELFPQVEKLIGDRTNPDDLAKLAGRKWDAVFDPSAYFPRIVQMSAEQLKGSTDFYVYVSSISAYRDHSTPKQDETSPVGTIEDPTIEEISGGSYGPLKALCERAVEQVFPGRALHVRAGLIIGPYDPTDRFTYWPVRIQRGGAFVAPEGDDIYFQFIDARDIAQWVLKMATDKTGGVFNVTGEPTRFGDVVAACLAVTGSSAMPVYMDTAFLEAHEVQPWQELTMWIPASNPPYAFMNDTSVAKAVSHGLTCRPLTETVRDLLKWHSTRELTQPPAFGLAPEKEQTVLEAWQSR